MTVIFNSISAFLFFAALATSIPSGHCHFRISSDADSEVFPEDAKPIRYSASLPFFGSGSTRIVVAEATSFMLSPDSGSRSLVCSSALLNFFQENEGFAIAWAL